MRNIIDTCAECSLNRLFDIDFHNELRDEESWYKQTIGETIEVGYNASSKH